MARCRQVPLNSPLVVDGVRITFVEANHCPGAAMILFEPPGRRPVLHTGAPAGLPVLGAWGGAGRGAEGAA